MKNGDFRFGALLGLCAIVVSNAFAQPSFTITSPKNGDNAALDADVPVSAELLDGNAEKVVFFAGDKSLGTDSERPYSVTWNEANPGDYSLSATAMLDDGQTVTAPAVLAKRSAQVIATGLDWEQVHTRSASYSYLFTSIDGALYHGSLQLSSQPGLFKSTDNGESWNRVWRDGNHPQFKMVANDDHYFIAGGGGIYRSDKDDGNWTRTSSTLRGGSVAFSLAAVGDTIVAGSQDGKIQRSTNNGQTWSNVHNTFSDDELYGSLGIISSIVHHKGYLFLTSSYKGVARSSDYGATWEPGRGDLPVRDNPKMINGSKIAATTNALYGIMNGKVYKSEDRGDTWTLVSDNNPKDIFTWNDNVLIVANSGTVQLLQAGSAQLVTITENLQLPGLSMASFAVDDEYIYLAIEPNGSGNAQLWRRPIVGSSEIAARNQRTIQRNNMQRHQTPTIYDLRGRRIGRTQKSGAQKSIRNAKGIFIIKNGKDITTSIRR